LGYEAQASPVYQITPTGNIVYLNGLQAQNAFNARIGVQASAQRDLGRGVTAELAVDATLKNAPAALDTNFTSASFQPSVHRAWGAAQVGAGLSFQHFDVAGKPFRDTQGVSFNWTLPSPTGLWGAVADVSYYRHAPEWTTLDATSQSVVLIRQMRQPGAGLDSLDFSAIVGKEINKQGIPELSSRNAMLSATLRWSGVGADWSLGQAYREARFDDAAFVNEPARIDRTSMTDVSAQWPLSARHALRFEYNAVRNASNTRLYDSSFEQYSVSLRSTW